MMLVGDRQRLVEVEGQHDILSDVTKRVAPDNSETMRAPWAHG